MRLKASMPKDVTLPISSTSSVAGKSASCPSAPKKRRGVNTVDQAFNKEATDELDCIIARMFYIGGLSFNLIRNPWYIKAFKFAANNPIVGCKPLSYNSLSTTLLQREKSHVKGLMEPIRATWKQKWVSICSDGGQMHKEDLSLSSWQSPKVARCS